MKAQGELYQWPI